MARFEQALLDVLKKVDRPGTFCASGALPPELPGLEVAGVGSIALPLGKRDAAGIKKVARQAPYGRGRETVVDTNVRRVWEVDADRVTLANPRWADVVGEAVRATQSALGLEKRPLDAHLYKLLLYEKGGFFLPHRDGERLDRMVGTLVITLPSAHEGGELVVRHDGREVVVDVARDGEFHTQFAAFYADCEHEVRPVTSGFRLALVYNLTLRKSKGKITAPTSREQVAAAARLLGEWSAAGPAKIAVLLDHQYSEAGLTRDALKGVDQAKADVLFSAAREAGCDAFLALVTYWVSGAADEDDYGYGRRRRRRWDEEEDDDDDGGDDEGEGGEHRMGEVFDESLTAGKFSDAEGKPLEFGHIPLEEQEVISSRPLKAGKPDKEDFEGYTGNEGMTLDRWYHRAAVVIWPMSARFDVLCEAGMESAVGGLAQMVQRLKRGGKEERDALKLQCLAFAGRIIANWPPREYAHRRTWPPPNVDGPTPSLAAPLKSLGEPALVSAYIRRVLATDVSDDPGTALGDICERLGWATFRDELLALFQGTSNETIERNARLLADLALREGKDSGRAALVAELAGAMLWAVERWKPGRADRDWQAASVEPGRLLPHLVRSFVAAGQPDLLDGLATHVLGLKEFDLTTVQAPVLLDLGPWLKKRAGQCGAPLIRWLTALRETLESRVANPPREPTDWRRGSAKGCACADCKELNQFLQDPHRDVLRISLAERRRRHLHGVIDGQQLDTTHVTQRRGSPFTLVCTKTKASYERAVKAHAVDVEQLAKVRGLIGAIERR